MARRNLYGAGTTAHYYPAPGEPRKAVKLLSQRQQEKCRDSKTGHVLRPRANDQVSRRGRRYFRICIKCGASLP